MGLSLKSLQLVDPSIEERYGTLIYDLCETSLWSKKTATQVYRHLLHHVQKKIRRSQRQRFEEYERAYILSLILKELESATKKHGRTLSSAEQIMLDSSLDVDGRLRFFESYLKRLSFEDLMVLLLIYKHEIPLEEVAAAMSLPVETIHLIRDHSLKTLEAWIWKNT